MGNVGLCVDDFAVEKLLPAVWFVCGAAAQIRQHMELHLAGNHGLLAVLRE